MTPALERLPHPRARLTPGRKAAVLDAIRAGSVTRADVIAHYGLSAPELFSWELGYRAHGQAGLSVMRIQEFR